MSLGQTIRLDDVCGQEFGPFRLKVHIKSEKEWKKHKNHQGFDASKKKACITTFPNQESLQNISSILVIIRQTCDQLLDYNQILANSKKRIPI
jgi:hypothetical protein